MDFFFDIDDDSHRLVCRFHEGAQAGMVTASDATSAGAEFLLALDDVRDTGFGECFWQEGCGEYHWLLRRSGQRVTIVALWSSGTLTGWQHVLRTEADFAAFESHLRARLPVAS